MIIFTPLKLEKVKEQISELHGKDGILKTIDLNGDSLKKIIFKIVSLNEIDIESYAFTLTKSEITALSSYIFTNHYGVDLTNIIKVIAFRVNDTIVTSVFGNWQQVFDATVGTIVFEYIDREKNARDIFETKYEYKLRELIEAIQNRKVISYFIDTVNLYDITLLDEYKRKLEDAGVVLERKLGQALIDRFYCLCSKAALLRVEKEYIYNFLYKAPQEISIGILRNFLNKLKPEELREFNLLIPLFLKHTGRSGTRGFDSLTDSLSPDQKHIYISWISDYDLEQAFINDKNNERLIFWRQFWGLYHSDPVNKHDMLVMNFEKFVVVEFYKIGTLYWFNNDYFQTKVKEHYKDTTVELKSWLHNYSVDIHRKKHIGDWTRDAYSVTTRLMRR